MEEFKKKFEEMIEAASNITITSHKGPDSDALSSALALYSYLSEKYSAKNFKIIWEGKKVESFNYLFNFEKIIWSEDSRPYFDKSDLIIFLDGNSLKRFTEFSDSYTIKCNTICLDHHTSEGDTFTLSYIDKSFMATCQLLADVLFQDSEITKPIAELLLEGILGDSGYLTYIRKDNSKVLITTKRLLELFDLNIEQIKLKSDKFSEESFRIFKEFINNTNRIKVNENFTYLTYSYLGINFFNSIIDKNNAKDPKFSALILRHFEDSNWGFTVKPDSNNKNEFGISFRSSENCPNVRLICEKYFNGGGHDRAAGGSYVLKAGQEHWDSVDVCNYIIETLKTAEIEMIK